MNVTVLFQLENTPITYNTNSKRKKSVAMYFQEESEINSVLQVIWGQNVHSPQCQAQWSLQFSLVLLDHFSTQLIIVYSYKQNTTTRNLKKIMSGIMECKNRIAFVRERTVKTQNKHKSLSMHHAVFWVSWLLWQDFPVDRGTRKGEDALFQMGFMA